MGEVTLDYPGQFNKSPHKREAGVLIRGSRKVRITGDVPMGWKQKPERLDDASCWF